MPQPKTLPPTANEITKEILRRVTSEMSEACWLWRNNRFTGKAVGSGGKTRHVSAGIDGQADLSGVVSIEVAGRRFGVRIEAEIKADYAHGRDRQSYVQEGFQRRLEAMGGIYMIVDRVGWGADDRPDVSAFMERLRKVAEG